MQSTKLAGAHALVTGGGRGIGRATALALSARGAHVVVTDVDGDAAEKVVAQIEEHGGEATAEQLDVTDAAAVDALAARTPVDVLVANAGVGMSGRLTDMTLDDWHWIRAVNLDGVVHTLRAFGPGMLERRHGHAAVLSSGFGYTPRATEAAYCTTKAAVLTLAQSLRADWGRHGVGVSAICPGVINTGITERARFIGVSEEELRRANRLFTRGHRPEIVAKAIVRAVERNRAVVPVGWEAHLGWWAHRYGPVRLHQRIARQGTP